MNRDRRSLHFLAGLVSLIVLHCQTGLAFQEAEDKLAPESGFLTTEDVSGTGISLESEPEADPCDLPHDRPLYGLDTTRRFMFDTVCTAARWIDGFFGDIRYDEAAPGVRGRLSLGVERREDSGLDFRPRFRVRVPLPNLAKRLSIYVEREDETRSIEGRNVEGQQAVEPISTTTATTDSTQVGFVRSRGDFDFRLGLRAPRGQLDYYGRVRYRNTFWRTDLTQWRFSQTFYWRHSEGWGETSQLDYETKLSERYFLRWYNTATWAQTTEGVSWNSGLPLYRTLRGGQVVVIEPNVNGQTGLPHAVSSYGVRGAYRQTLGRRWLFGEIYLGQDRVKSSPGRDVQFFAGFIVELVFERPPPEAPAAPAPVAPGETSPVR
jgi:hypothetical protein